MVSVIDDRLEDFYFLPGELCAPQAPDQFLEDATYGPLAGALKPTPQLRKQAVRALVAE